MHLVRISVERHAYQEHLMFKTVVCEMETLEIAQWKAVTRLILDAQRESLFLTKLFHVDSYALPSMGVSSSLRAIISYD